MCHSFTSHIAALIGDRRAQTHHETHNDQCALNNWRKKLGWARPCWDTHTHTHAQRLQPYNGYTHVHKRSVLAKAAAHVEIAISLIKHCRCVSKEGDEA